MKIKTNYFKIRQHLEETYQLYKSSRVETTLDMLLSRLGNSYDEYIYFLRWSLSRDTVFLKRTCKDIMMNPYNKKIFVRHRANMDIQYVIDPWLRRLYFIIHVKIECNNVAFVEKCSNKFNNCAEISAEECSYTVMGMNFCRISRSIGFLNTNPSNQRTRMIMEERWLRLMDPDST
ncbi:unnamed protein product, partial [Brachionus calyciflorus]